MLIKTLIIGITVFAIIDAILMYLILVGGNITRGNLSGGNKRWKEFI